MLCYNCLQRGDFALNGLTVLSDIVGNADGDDFTEALHGLELQLPPPPSLSLLYAAEFRMV